MTNLISYETKYFIKKLNSSKSNLMRGRLIKNHLMGLFLNKDLTMFLDEFVGQISEQDKRIKMLLLCRKLLLQNPRQLGEAHYQAFKEQYDFEIANDTSVDGIRWIDEELNFIKEVNGEEVFEPLDRRKKLGEPTMPLENVIPHTALMKLEEILEEFDISKSTLDRWREDGFPCDKVGKKLYANREAVLAWIRDKKPNKIQFCISKK